MLGKINMITIPLSSDFTERTLTFLTRFKKYAIVQVMKHKVMKKQFNYHNCFVCGVKNHSGLKASFYEMDDGKLACLVTGRDEHQSYPDRMHGGVTSALLDEAIGRTMLITDFTIWGVTMSLQIKYRKPVPLNVPLLIVSEIVEDSFRTFKGIGKMYGRNNELLAEGEAVYFKVPYNSLKEHLEHEETLVDDSITEIDYE